MDYVHQLLGHLNVVDNPSEQNGQQPRVWLRSSTQPMRTTGIFVPRLCAGTHFSRGDVIAHIRGVNGRVIEELTAATDGVVIAWRDIGWAKTGSVVGTLGEAIE